MATEYMIGVCNRYANLLDDTEDPLEILSNLQVAEKKLDRFVKHTKKAPVDKTKEKRQATDKNDAQKETVPPAVDKTRKVTFGPKQIRIVQQGDASTGDEMGTILNSPDEFANKRREAEQEYLKRSGKLNRVRVFYYRGGGHSATDCSVKYDRHSNSLHSRVKPIEKRHGGGAHNWGNILDDANLSVEEESLDSPEQLAKTVPEETTEPPAGESEKLIVEAGTKEEDLTEKPVEQLTLEEWKALRGERQKPSFNLRKPGEGENYEKKWKKMVVINKKQHEDDEPVYETIHCPQRVGRQKFVPQIEVRFSKPARRGRPPIGARNGPPQQSLGPPDKENEAGEPVNENPLSPPSFQNGARTGSGSGRGFNNNRRQPAPQVDNEQDFPALR